MTFEDKLYRRYDIRKHTYFNKIDVIDFPINIIFLKSLILKHLVLCKEIAAAKHLHCAFAKPTLRIKFTGTYFADRGKQQSCLFTI